MRNKNLRKTALTNSNEENKENIMQQMELVKIDQSEAENSSNQSELDISKLNLAHWTQLYNQYSNQIKQMTEEVKSTFNKYPTKE